MDRIPRVVSVAAIGETELLVHFDNGADKVYDLTPLLSKPPFQMLNVPAFRKAVTVDPGGYGISWNDDIDLSEYELWTNGQDASNELLKHTA